MSRPDKTSAHTFTQSLSEMVYVFSVNCRVGTRSGHTVKR